MTQLATNHIQQNEIERYGSKQQTTIREGRGWTKQIQNGGSTASTIQIKKRTWLWLWLNLTKLKQGGT